MKVTGVQGTSTFLIISRSLVLAMEPENQKSLATQLLKPFVFDHRIVLVAGFADVHARWQWGPPVSTPLSSPLSFSFFSPISLSPRRCPISPPPLLLFLH
jgi:hypothetical protein